MNRDRLIAEYEAGRRDFQNENLSGIDLGGAVLPNIDLSSANLSGANMSKAVLSNAKMCSANLTGANLYGAQLDSVKLLRANLTWANLTGAQLARTNLHSATLSGANLVGADLSSADIFEAKLDSANLSAADLSDACMLGANLFRSNLSEAYLLKSNLSGANLAQANLYGAHLRGVLNFPESEIAIRTIVPQKGIGFRAWKKLKGGKIAELWIPDHAERVGGLTGRECRSSSAVVVSGDGESLSSFGLKYKPGTVVVAKGWDSNPLLSCAGGIHFFLTKEEAEVYC